VHKTLTSHFNFVKIGLVKSRHYLRG